MSSPQKSPPSPPSGGDSPLAIARGSNSSNMTPSQEQPATQPSGSPADVSHSAMAQDTFHALPAGPAPTAPRSSRATIAEITRKLEAKHQANLAARDEQRRQQQRAEELERNRKREREASPTLDLPQMKSVLERHIAEGQERGMKPSKSTFNHLQTSAGSMGDDRTTAVPDRSSITHKSPCEFVCFPKCEPPTVACSVQLQDMPRIGDLTTGRNTWKVLLRIDGGHRGDPSLELIFEANLERRTNERAVSKNPDEIIRCVFRWKPRSAAVHLAGTSELDHLHNIDFFSFREIPPASGVRSRVTNDGKIPLVFCLTNAILSHEGAPFDSAWEQYGDIKDVICEMASSRKRTITIAVRQDHRYHWAACMLQKAYARRFHPLYTYNQEGTEPTAVLDLREMDTVTKIRKALERHMPFAKTWKDASAEDTDWTPEWLFDLPKHLDSLQRLGIRITPEETADEATEKPVQGSLDVKTPGKVVEEPEEGSEEGEILG